MALHRRAALHLAGAAALGAVAGCANLSIGGNESAREYALDVHHVEASPVEYALYETRDTVYDRPARRAVEAILPEGRHTTYGFEPLPEDAYLEHEGRYYQTKTVVTGQREMDRHLVRASRVPEGEIPDDAVAIDTLPKQTARVIKVLHAHARPDGESPLGEQLRGDAYVLRRPYETESRLTGDLDGQVVTVDRADHWAYRIEVTTEPLRETEYTTFAVELTDSRATFRDVVFATRVDSQLEPSTLSASARDVLDQSIDREGYRETTPLSDGFAEVLDALHLDDSETASDFDLLWYREQLYLYALYVADAE